MVDVVEYTEKGEQMEYKLITYNINYTADVEDKLNKLAREGWLIIAFSGSTFVLERALDLNKTIYPNNNKPQKEEWKGNEPGLMVMR